MVYTLVRQFWRIALRVFFRRIEVEGADHVPTSGPVLLVPNHPNAMIDPLVVAVKLKRPIAITAKSTFFKMPIFGRLVRAMHVIPFHRTQDREEGVKVMSNRQTLVACRERLAEGAAVCVFPEGQSHNEPKLRPFKHGAATIAVDYVLRDRNPGRLQVVPVGLHFEEKDRWRSDVVVRFGEPIDVGMWAESQAKPRARDFTALMERRVEELTASAERRRQLLTLTWAAEVLQKATPREPLAGRVSLVRRLREGYLQLRDRRPEELLILGRRIRAYRAALRRLGIKPGEVFVPVRPGRAVSFLIKNIPILLLGSPLFVFGVINHILPYLLVRSIARRKAKTKDHWASYTVYPGLFAFPLFYAIQIALAWIFLPWPLALSYSVLLPLSGWFTVRYDDRMRDAWRRSRTFLRFMVNRRLQRQLIDEANTIVAEIERLSAELPPPDA